MRSVTNRYENFVGEEGEGLTFYVTEKYEISTII